MLQAWAARWRIPPQALGELATLFAGGTSADIGTSEAAVQALVRLEASRAGARLWRNNLGAGKLENGSFIRWGLCNDSAAVNAALKSADLIGITPRTITQADVGTVIGQFLSREIKQPGWRYTGTPREEAQLAWCTLITMLGGDACFATGPGTIRTPTHSEL